MRLTASRLARSSPSRGASQRDRYNAASGGISGAVLALQAAAGNQAVQQLLRSSRGGTILPLQRLTAEDLPDEVRAYGGLNGPTGLLKAFTDWENQAPSPMLARIRRRRAATRINDAYWRNRRAYWATDSAEDNFRQLLQDILKELVESEKVDDLKADPFDAFVAVVFPRTWKSDPPKFVPHEYVPLRKEPSGFEAERQVEILRLMVESGLGFGITPYLTDFPIWPKLPELRLELFVGIATKHRWITLEPIEREQTLAAFFGGLPERQEALLALRKTSPALYLQIMPETFLPKGELDVEELNKHFGTTDLQPIFKAITELKKEYQTEIVREFADFFARSGRTPRDLAAIAETVASVIQYRYGAIRGRLYDALVDLLKVEPEPEDTSSDESSDEEGKRKTSSEGKVETSATKVPPFLLSIEKANYFVRPTLVLLSRAWPDGLENQDVKEFFGKSKTSRALKDSSKSNTVNLALLDLSDALSYAAPGILVRLFADIAELDPTDVVAIFGAIRTCIRLQLFDLLSKEDDFTKLKGDLEQAFSGQLGLKEGELTEEGVTRLTEKLRTVDDLLVYAATLKQIEEKDERERALQNLRLFVQLIVADPDNASFRGYRYGEVQAQDRTKWEHLDSVLKVPEVRKAWKTAPPGRSIEEGGKKWVIRDTDEPGDLLRLGSDFQTCQSVERGATTSKALLSYLLDGKNRAIVVRLDDPKLPEVKRKMVARALFRILVTTKTNEVALYLEKPYFGPEVQAIKDQLTNHIIELARARAVQIAKHLKVKLLLSQEGYGALTREKVTEGVKTLGKPGHGPAEFDYNETKVGAVPSIEIDPVHLVELPI